MRPPQAAIAAVRSLVQNQPMERFAGFRQALTHRAKPASNSRLPDILRAEATAEDTTGSKLAGLLMLFVPLAAAAWVAIGWLIYRLAT
jgi:hypothetical protein